MTQRTENILLVIVGLLLAAGIVVVGVLIMRLTVGYPVDGVNL